MHFQENTKLNDSLIVATNQPIMDRHTDELSIATAFFFSVIQLIKNNMLAI